MFSSVSDWFKARFGRFSDFRSRKRKGDEHKEGGYVLFFVTIVGFLLTANYLLGQAPSEPEQVRLAYIVEPSGKEMSPSEALAKLNAGEFKEYQGGTETLDLGYMREGVWVRMTFRNDSHPDAGGFVLQLRHTYINGSFSELKPDAASSGAPKYSIVKTKEFSDKLLPRTQGLNDIRHVSFQFDVAPHAEFTALVRLKAHVMSVPFLLLPERAFLSSIVREMVVTASYFGGLMLLALYNAMVGMARRESEFVFYGLYVAAISLMIVAINGSGHMFIWPDNLWLHYNSANLLINLCCMSYLAFTLFLFRHDPVTGWERKLWTGLFLMCGTGLVLQMAEGGFFASIEANIAVLATLCASLLRAWRARPVYGRIANLFLLSEGILFLGALVYCVKMFGWLPSTPFTINIVTLAATLEGILLSFVLSEKMRRTMDERELALQKLAAAQQHLEASVADRTLALAARYTSHEVLNPVFAIRLKVERICEEVKLGGQNAGSSGTAVIQVVAAKAEEIFKLIDSIIQTIRAIKTIAGGRVHKDAEGVDVASAFEDALRMLEAKSLQVNCRIDAAIESGTLVFARRSDVVHILMNLVSNSLDALSMAQERWIRVSSRQITLTRDSVEKLMVEIEVLDSGGGPHPDIRPLLFEGEVTTKPAGGGMGLGLAFCQRLVERNEGSIAFDPSSPFTRFFFLLPVSQGTAAENPDSPARKAA